MHTICFQFIHLAHQNIVLQEVFLMSREPLEVFLFFFFAPRPPLSLAPVINFNSEKPGPGTCSEPASWVLRPCFLRLFPHQQYWGKELCWAFCGWASSPARGTSHVPGCGSGMLRAGTWGGNGICWDCRSDTWIQNHVEPVLPREPGFQEC